MTYRNGYRGRERETWLGLLNLRVPMLRQAALILGAANLLTEWQLVLMASFHHGDPVALPCLKYPVIVWAAGSGQPGSVVDAASFTLGKAMAAPAVHLLRAGAKYAIRCSLHRV